jgi:hypothetical protein
MNVTRMVGQWVLAKESMVVKTAGDEFPSLRTPMMGLLESSNDR